MTQSADILRRRLEGIRDIPSLPSAVAPLLEYLNQPLELLDVQHVVDLISQDKSLAVQCLHLANSPLFGRWQAVDTVRAAVIAIGMQRMREIVYSCSLLTLDPATKDAIDPVVFWEHSLGCALLSRRLAHKIGFRDPGKAYLAGLLHDIGILLNLWILPKEFKAAIEHARAEGIPLHEAETTLLGFTHCESGRMLVDAWKLSDDLQEVISAHHDIREAGRYGDLLAVVTLSDLICRMSGLGHGIIELRQVDLQDEPVFALLRQHCPAVEKLDWARLTFELEGYLDEVHRLVSRLYRPQQ